MTKNENKKEIENIFKPITPDTFQKLMGETFRSINITLVSIVQGVSLGILIFNTAGLLLSESDGLEYYFHFIYPIFSLIGIIIITFEYTHYVGIFRRSVKISDIIIPYLLGISQSLPMFFFNNPEKWWFFEAFIMLSAALAWYNTQRGCKIEVFGEYESSRKRYHHNVTQKLLSALALSGMCFLAAYVISANQDSGFSMLWQAAFGIVLIGWAFWVLRSSHKLLNKLHEDFGFSPAEWF